jgi:hypothetical protein
MQTAKITTTSSQDIDILLKNSTFAVRKISSFSNNPVSTKNINHSGEPTSLGALLVATCDCI